MDKCLEDGHITKIAEMEYRLEDGDVKEYVTLYGCTRCDATSPTIWEDFGVVKKVIDHSNCSYDPCFGCKAKTLQLATGDAAGHIIQSGTTQKKWDKELEFYRQARKDGIQPEGTSTAAVEKAYQASEVLNKAYDGGKMPKAKAINKQTAEVMKEIGAI
jgi:hypothetical protein